MLTNENYANMAKDNLLKDIWNSLFISDIVKPLKDNFSPEIHATLMLLETALFNLKSFATEYADFQSKQRAVLNELNNAKEESGALRNKLKKLESSPCKNCSDLRRKLMTQQKEISDTKKQISSIVNILNVGSEKQPFTNHETQNALSLMNNMLDNVNDGKDRTSPKSKMNKSPSPRKFNKENEIIIAPDTLQFEPISDNQKLSARTCIVIPETEPISHIELEYEKYCTEKFDELLKTPNKIDSHVDKNIEKEKSPILERCAKRKRLFSSRVQNELSLSLRSCLQETASHTSDNVSPKDKECGDKRSQSETTIKSSPLKASRKIISPIKDKPTHSRWLLKQNRCIEENSGTSGKLDKRLKQTTLSLKPVEIESDITKIEGFNGGIHSSTSSLEVLVDNIAGDDDDDDDDDVVLSSPFGVKKVDESTRSKSKAAKKLFDLNTLKQTTNKIPVVHLDSLDDTVFAPMATSTEKIDFSFDRVPGREKKSPNYKYKRDAVRKKSERMKLPGQECDKCANFYVAAGGSKMTKIEKKNLMNGCSRHRDKFPLRRNTPPGFWDPDFPPSPEDEDEEREDEFKPGLRK